MAAAQQDFPGLLSLQQCRSLTSKLSGRGSRRAVPVLAAVGRTPVPGDFHGRAAWFNSKLRLCNVQCLQLRGQRQQVDNSRYRELTIPGSPPGQQARDCNRMKRQPVSLLDLDLVSCWAKTHDPVALCHAPKCWSSARRPWPTTDRLLDCGLHYSPTVSAVYSL